MQIERWKLLEFNTFKEKNRQYPRHYFSDKGLQGTLVIWTFGKIVGLPYAIIYL